MKRFTDTNTLRDPWVRQLSLDSKLVYWYLKENCDAAGVWEPDFKLVNFTFERDIDWPQAKEQLTASFNGDHPRVEILGNGKWYLTRFVIFQNGKLSEECFPHRKVIELLGKHGLLNHWSIVGLLPTTLPPTLPGTLVKPKTKTTLPGRVPGTLQEEEGEEAEAKDKSPLQIRIERWFNRRLSTAWGRAELRAWHGNRLVIESTPPEDVLLLEGYYTGPNRSPYCRRDITTLLNNWTGEIDRARDRKEHPHATDKPNPRSYAQTADYSGVKNK